MNIFYGNKLSRGRFDNRRGNNYNRQWKNNCQNRQQKVSNTDKYR